MHRKTITVTEEMDAFITQKVASGHYGNVSEFIRQLIRREMEKTEPRLLLNNLLDEGLNSGVSDRNFDDIHAAAISRSARDA